MNIILTNVVGVKITPLAQTTVGQVRMIVIYTTDDEQAFELRSPPNTEDMPVDVETPTMY